jgi:hypothetical protein
MYVRRLVRILILVAAVAAVALSCNLIDYELDFSITDVAYSIGGTTVTVSYTMTNSGGYDMENAALRILVTVDGVPALGMWTPDGVYLSTFGSSSGSLTYTHWTTISSSATAVVTGTRWDRGTDLE